MHYSVVLCPGKGLKMEISPGYNLAYLPVCVHTCVSKFTHVYNMFINVHGPFINEIKCYN